MKHPSSIPNPAARRALPALALLALLGGAVFPAAAKEGKVGEMVRIRNEVLGREPSVATSSRMQVLDPVVLNMEIETLEDALAEMVFHVEEPGKLDGSLHLGPETKIVIDEGVVSPGGETSLLSELFGKLLVVLSPSAKRKIEVKTPTAVIGIRGTLVGITVDPDDGSTRVSVFEGSVEVEAVAGGARQVVKEGFRTVVEPGRRPSLPTPLDPRDTAGDFELEDPIIRRDPGERPILPRDPNSP